MQNQETKTTLNCAIYTRKSTDDGLEQEFNSLDAQRLAGESYIASQISEGWVCLPDRYDDGGYTGGNMERPGLKRLMLDIETKRIDCVVVYKVDRLSRSLIDFAKLMDAFERNNIAFVSVTQQFNTGNSMGRLMLNVLLSFAQFEREMISERTRDKMAATRRQGRWTGGPPVLGYDPVNGRLVVNEAEAAVVRDLFAIYIEKQSLKLAAKAAKAKGYKAKQWLTKKGTLAGGKPLRSTILHHIITNRLYLGQVLYKGEIYEGEHDAIIDVATFEQAQRMLKRNAVDRGASLRNRHGALLKGLVYCANCNCSMHHSHTSKVLADKTRRIYRYYCCSKAQEYGWHTCPTPSIPAIELENFVIKEIASISSDQALLDATLAACRAQLEETIKGLEGECLATERDVARLNRELGKQANDPEPETLAQLNDDITSQKRHLDTLRKQLKEAKGNLVEAADIKSVCATFSTLWDSLTTNEQIRMLELVVERVIFNGSAGTVAITFRPLGIKTLTWVAD